MSRTVHELFDLKGRVALVTGGSRGLGLQMAHALGEAGARVLVTARKADELEGAVAQLRGAGIDAQWIAADCAKEADIHRLAADTLQRMGAVDILVNNAGAAWGAPAEDHPIEAWDKVMNLNVRGYFILSQYLAKHHMIARRKGSIINVASIAGLGGNPRGMNTIAYNTSKGAVINFTRALAAEWGPYGIRVNAIMPGATNRPGAPPMGVYPLDIVERYIDGRELYVGVAGSQRLRGFVGRARQLERRLPREDAAGLELHLGPTEGPAVGGRQVDALGHTWRER